MISSTLAGASGVLLAPALNLDVVLLSGLVVAAFAVAAFAGLAEHAARRSSARSSSRTSSAAVLSKHPFPVARHRVERPRALPACSPSSCSSTRPRSGPCASSAAACAASLRERASGNVSTALALVVVLTVVGLLLNPSWAFTGQQVAAYSIAALSLVLLVGASGQISLGAGDVHGDHRRADGTPRRRRRSVGSRAPRRRPRLGRRRVRPLARGVPAARPLPRPHLVRVRLRLALRRLPQPGRDQLRGPVDRPARASSAIDIGNDRNFLVFAWSCSRSASSPSAPSSAARGAGPCRRSARATRSRASRDCRCGSGR